MAGFLSRIRIKFSGSRIMVIEATVFILIVLMFVTLLLLLTK